MHISVILGTRPEIVKCSPIIRECCRLNLNYFILHTGQHYSYNMDKVFFEQLNLPEAKYNLDVGSGSHGQQTGKMLAGIEEVLLKESPDIVLVEGDTNSVLAGALAAVKLGIKVGHVEAGLRSYVETCRKRLTEFWLITVQINFLLQLQNLKKYYFTKAWKKRRFSLLEIRWSMLCTRT